MRHHKTGIKNLAIFHRRICHYKKDHEIHQQPMQELRKKLQPTQRMLLHEVGKDSGTLRNAALQTQILQTSNTRKAMMNNFILPFQNWRVFLLCVLSMFAVIFLLAEGDNAAAFVAYKIASAALIALIYYLVYRWADDGHFKDLRDILNDEED